MLSGASEPLLNQRELLTKTFSRCRGFFFPSYLKKQTRTRGVSSRKKGYWKNLINILLIIIKAKPAKQPTTASNLQQSELNIQCTLAGYEQTASTVFKVNYDQTQSEATRGLFESFCVSYAEKETICCAKTALTSTSTPLGTATVHCSHSS